VPEVVFFVLGDFFRSLVSRGKYWTDQPKSGEKVILTQSFSRSIGIDEGDFVLLVSPRRREALA